MLPLACGIKYSWARAAELNVFFYGYLSSIDHIRSHVGSNFTWVVSKGWSPKFATGINIIIGIVQKV